VGAALHTTAGRRQRRRQQQVRKPRGSTPLLLLLRLLQFARAFHPAAQFVTLPKPAAGLLGGLLLLQCRASYRGPLTAVAAQFILFDRNQSMHEATKVARTSS